MNPVEQYLSDMGSIRATQAGTGETSYYTALSTLLNEIGSTLNPKVRCVIQLQNKGAGMPDGGMFTADQFKTKAAKQNAGANPLAVLPPSRGVIEVKSPAEDMPGIIASEQIARYWEHYGLVLVTNYRAFTLIGRTPSGEAVELEGFTLAGTEAEFWKLAAHPRTCPDPVRERFAEYLHRVMIHNAPLASPQDVAAILASYARDAKARIGHADLPALAGLREALENALGLKFEGEKGEHFFRSTLIQTLFYGIFSAWVLWARKRKPAPAAKEKTLKYALKESAATYHADSKHFDWHTAVWHLRVPMIRALFEQVATPARLGPLGLEEVLDWATAALNRVDGDAFFTAFDEEHAVQYFYEPFLQAFDPELRKDLGVWYTPSEIVDYQVERVDTVLREELHIADGRADPRVIVLDPCCGTGAYVRAVLQRIAKTLDGKHGDGMTAGELKDAALERVLGFEILPAPFVIAHLQIGLLLETLGAPLNDAKDERVGVYLTNSLTGWEPPKEKAKQVIMFPELELERDAATKVKQGKKIIVVLGNPPYNGFAGVSPEEENDLVEPYKKGLASKWGIKKFNLDDLYVRFFRLAEKRITEHSGMGVVSFISNFSYLSDPSFVVMRQRFLDEFDKLWFDCLNGDSRETGKQTPEGKPDPSVFSTQWNREGIRVGTAIGLMVKRGKRVPESPALPEIRFRQLWGAKKREELLASLSAKKFDAQYDTAAPAVENRWSFRPSEVTAAYLGWPKVTDLCKVPPFNGPIERRGNSLIVFPEEKNRLNALSSYLDPRISDEEISGLVPEYMNSSGEFKAAKTRSLLKGRVFFDSGKIVRYPFKPFDVRFAYLDGDIQPLFSRPSPTLLSHGFDGNRFFITRDTADKDPEGPPFLLSTVICDYDCISGHARHFPIRLTQDKKTKVTGKDAASGKKQYTEQHDLFATDTTSANLSPAARAYLDALGLPNPDGDTETAEVIWMHALAIGYAPSYLTENSDGIRQDWPRIPLPAAKAALLASAKLGRQVAALLDTETPVPGVTCGAVRGDLKTVAACVRADGKPINADAGDLELTAGWGH
ncbi:MAG: type ISP restriction/modification enzyme, partial [bacterium]